MLNRRKRYIRPDITPSKAEGLALCIPLSNRAIHELLVQPGRFVGQKLLEARLHGAELGHCLRAGFGEGRATTVRTAGLGTYQWLPSLGIHRTH